jgi:hypothetical protein
MDGGAKSSTLDGKRFVALLKGLIRKVVQLDTSITEDLLATEIYGIDGDAGDEAIMSEIQSLGQLLKRAAREYWETNKLQTFLQSTSDLSKDRQNLLCTFWTNEREKIHSEMSKRSRWNNEYHQLAWRVDLKAASRHSPDINEPLAIFEFSSKKPLPSAAAARARTQYPGGGNGATGTAETSVARAQFQMDRVQLDGMLKTLDAIKKSVEEAAGSG